MPESDPLQILLSHDRWATGQILDACEKLNIDQFHRRFEMGFGSLHETLTHMIAATRAWTESLAGAEPRPRMDADGQRRTAAELRALHEQAWRALADEAARRAVGEMVTRTLRNGNTVSLTRAAVFAQVTTHGMHHRAQCLNMLRQLGVAPLPPSSVAEWAMTADTNK